MSEITLRHPTVDDGGPVWALVRDSGVLDLNSRYAYLALFRHFAPTCVVAERDGRLLGFVTGHRLPERPDTWFLWQVGVDAAARGEGLATRMIRWVLAQPGCEGVSHLETTVTPSNQASRRLFHGLARRLDTELSITPGFTAAQLGGDHEPEELFRLGPFSRSTP